jgi:crotonobetainyl-CoA:carnitine CoA-transferase CaiB-like acyl-CoA transferase
MKNKSETVAGNDAAQGSVEAVPSAASGPLAGVTVLDLTRFYSGPFATLLLAGYGAEVIRIDRPGQGEPAMSGPPFFGQNGVSLERQHETDLGLAYLKRCRSKKAITLDLESNDGLQLFHRLLKVADVIVENFRPGFTKKLCIDYAANAKVNPGIVHCALTGYGSSGPDRDLKAYDLMIQADSGLMSVTGNPEGPPRKAGTALADGISGVFAASAILAALIERRQSGRGQFIDVAMADCLLALVLDEPLDCYGDMKLAPRQGNRIMRFSPFDTFRTLDGYVAIGVATEREWQSLVVAMGRDDLREDPEFARTSWRVTHNDEVNTVVEIWTKSRTTAAALDTLRACDVPASPIRGIDDLMQWRHLRNRGMIVEIAHPAVTSARPVAAAAFPIKFSRTPGGYRTPAPVLGQDNDEIYGDRLQLDASVRKDLKARRVI